MSILLKDVSFTYPGGSEPTLNVQQWSVPAKQRVFVHGPSGTGKSTLLNLISGMLKPDSGEVSVFDQRLDQLNLRQLDRFRADHIGYVFQQFNLVSYLSALDNIRLADFFSKGKNHSNLNKDIQDLLTSLHVEKSEWQKPVGQLSMGQQQRVAIARAMINKPELLIADEPTSSLDEKNRDAFMNELMAMVEEFEVTLLFVSHDMSLASHFEQVDALADLNVSQVVS